MAHELVEAFAQAGTPLARKLGEMLDEHPSHCTDRRGCGLAQASRLLAVHANQPRDPLDPLDLGLFECSAQREVAALARRAQALGWPDGWRNLHLAPAPLRAELADFPGLERLQALHAALATVAGRLQFPESRLVFGLIADIVALNAQPFPPLPPMPLKPEIGSCSQAEEFFLEIAHGKVRRGGSVNIFVDAQGQPLLVEKIGLGESHSAMFVRPASICNVAIMPGALAALRHAEAATPIGRHRHGLVFSLAALEQVRFLRISTLSVAPRHRARAFGMQFRRQVLGNMVSPQSTTLEDLAGYAARCVQEV